MPRHIIAAGAILNAPPDTDIITTAVARLAPSASVRTPAVAADKTDAHHAATTPNPARVLLITADILAP